MQNILLLVLFLLFGSAAQAELSALWVEHEVLADSKSLLISAEMDSGEGQVYIIGLQGPRGERLVQSNFGKPAQRIPLGLFVELTSKIRITDLSPSSSVAFIGPHNYSSSIRGTWRLRLAYSGNVKPIIQFKEVSSNAGPKETNFWFVAHEDFDFDWLKEVALFVQGFYKKYGLKIQIHVHQEALPIVDDALDRWGTQLLEFHRNQHVLFFTRMNSLYGDKKIRGYTNCVPGFQAIYRHNRCFMTVGMSSDVEKSRLKKVIIHEMAHYLGLYHFEDDYYPFGKLTDGLSDTTKDNHINNVMDKTSYSTKLIEFTKGQVKVMKTHPALVQ